MDYTASVISFLQGSFFDWFIHLFQIFLHIDRYLGNVISEYGFWTYLILFIVVFCETGLVVTPFLPGDSLLFAAGSFAALGTLNPVILFIVIVSAAILGDNTNYWIGNFVGPRVFTEKVRFLKREYLEKTHKFYEKYGVKTVIIARFVPIVRTFAPFVAGIGKMTYRKFLPYDMSGAFLWVGTFVFAGYFFGTLPFVRNNFSYVVVVIILISITPILFELIRNRFKRTN
jgi:membrane-associated protein